MIFFLHLKILIDLCFIINSIVRINLRFVLTLSMYKGKKNNSAHFRMNRFTAEQCAELFFSLYIEFFQFSNFQP